MATKIINSDNARQYRTDAEFYIQERPLPALDYIPVYDAIQSFEHLCSNYLTQNIKKFFNHGWTILRIFSWGTVAPI